MKHVIRKAFYDFEKEEKWLNEMSAQGLALVDYSWCKYVFEDAPKGEYIYRLEYLEKSLKDPKSQEYIRFMEETGAEHIASYFRWVYFRRKAAEGEFDIYTDVDSKIRHYSRIRSLFFLLVGLNFLAGMFNLTHGSYEASMGMFPANTYISLISFFVVAILTIFLLLPLTRKITKLNKEKEFRE